MKPFQKSIEHQKTIGRRLTMGAADRLIRNANLHYRLAHAKDVALKQFEVRKIFIDFYHNFHTQILQLEKQRQGVSPVVNFVEQTLRKVKRDQPTPSFKFTRQLLLTMNITQLQIVINEIYTFNEALNETLMKYLLERDELLSKRDSLLIAIEHKSGHKRRIDNIEKV